MAKLYPPNINGTIPAFYTNIGEGTTKIVVPFSMNRAVAVSEMHGMSIKIKSLSGSVIGVVSSELVDTVGMTASFDISKFQPKLLLGNYYKIQVAYIDENGDIGYYSTVGVIKYTAMPSIKIEGLVEVKPNLNRYEYVGVYQQNLDPTEKLYSSQFILYDDDVIIYDTGEIIHDNTQDEWRDKAYTTIKLPIELVSDKYYGLRYKITTTNGLTLQTNRYKIIQRRSVDPSIKAELIATLDFNNGYIQLTLDDKVDSIISGNFVICRSSNSNNWSWERIKEFALQSTPPNKFFFKDCTIEQGVVYKYSIQQYNSANGIYSNRIISNTVDADFEDAFLYDGERQLRIRFDPKVSSFKATLQESKSDTIGYQYPFFTRNSTIYYKEFPIAGLISYLMDENELFISKEEIGLEYLIDDSTTVNNEPVDWGRNRYSERYNVTRDLTSRNISSERFFKMKVLEWLTNGKPKSFRSPGEGNYLVRLMNVSLSPKDQLGRMLHSFTCTAYEIADYTLDNLAYYGIYDPLNTEGTERRWVTIDLRKYIEENGIDLNDSNTAEWIPIMSELKMSEIFVQDMLPGSKIRIDKEELVIGSTGSYRAKNEYNPFTIIEVNKNSFQQGLVTYAYDAKISDSFSNIENIVVEDVPCLQIIGTSYQNYTDGGVLLTNLFDYLETINSTVLKINMLRVMKRPIIDGFINSDKTLTEIRYDLEEGKTQGMSFDTATDEVINLDDNVGNYNSSWVLPLYQLRLKRRDQREEATIYEVLNLIGETEQYIFEELKPYTFEQYYVDKHKDRFYPYTGYFYDPLTGTVFAANDKLFHFYIDGEDISIAEIETWEVRNLSTKIKTIEFNRGVYAELAYSRQRTEFAFDSVMDNDLRDYDLCKAREKYEDSLAVYLLAREGAPSTVYGKFPESTMEYIEAYLPMAALKLNGNVATFDGNIYNISESMSQIGQYYNGSYGARVGLKKLKETVKANYKAYIKKLDEVIKQYNEEHGTE